MRRNMKVRNVVVSVCCAFRRCLIDAILNDQGSEWSTGVNRLAHDYMSPRQWHPVRSNADFDAMHMHWTIVATAHVILARPNKFNRRAPQMFRDLRSFTRYVTIRNGAPAKTAAGKFGMESDLLRFQTQYFGDCHLIEGLKLRRNPCLCLVAIKADCGIQRLHRRVRKIWKLIFGNDSTAGGNLLQYLVITAGNRDVAGRASHFFVPGK